MGTLCGLGAVDRVVNRQPQQSKIWSTGRPTDRPIWPPMAYFLIAYLKGSFGPVFCRRFFQEFSRDFHRVSQQVFGVSFFTSKESLSRVILLSFQKIFLSFSLSNLSSFLTQAWAYPLLYPSIGILICESVCLWSRSDHKVFIFVLRRSWRLRLRRTCGFVYYFYVNKWETCGSKSSWGSSL